MAKQSKKKPVWGWVALVVAAAVIAGVGLWAAFAFLIPGNVEVPDLVGTREQAARLLLTGKGLKMAGTLAFSDTVPKEEIVSQKPRPGATVKKGATVRVVISKGPRMIEVPDLSNLTREDAIEKLELVGLRAGSVTHEYNQDFDDDVVFRQSPRAGEKLRKDEAVDLVVSKGVRTTVVPNVVGMSAARARKALGGAGLAINSSEQASSQEPAGVVLSQDPVAKQVLAVGRTVTIVVSTGAPFVTMPSVVGWTQSSATNKLEGLGLDVRTEYVPEPTTKVVKQAPKPGVKLRQGSNVQLWVGEGSAP